MINFVLFSYVPNTASTNRLLSYIRNIPQEIKVRVFFIMPDKNFSKIKDVPQNVEVVYCWDKFRCKNKLFKYIFYKLSIQYVKRQLHEKDIVYTYETPSFINSLFKKGVKFYSEKTEHPKIVKAESRLISTTLVEHLQICRKLDGIFVISTALKEYYIDNGIDEEKIEIINMTVDPIRFNNLEKGNVADKYIAYCGSATNNKDGVDKLIKSFAILRNKFHDIKLYIIGKSYSHTDGDSNYKLAQNLGLIDSIVFTGSVPSEEMPQLLKNAEALALNRPDSLQALCGFPTKLGEYLLTGNPVVVTTVGDIPKFLEDGVSALLAPPTDDNAFAEKLIWILEHPKEAETIGLKGREVAMNCFNAKVEVNKMLNFMTKQ